jgi:hypothetical protein
LLISALEFLGSPNAIFEISPTAFDSPDGQNIYQRLETICGANSPYRNHYADLFQSDLARLVAREKSYLSYVYFIAVPAQVGLHISLLSAFMVIVYFRKQYITTVLDAWRSPWLKQNFFVVFGLALIIGAIWCLYRISYRIDNNVIFGNNNPLYGDYIAFGIYFVVIHRSMSVCSDRTLTACEVEVRACAKRHAQARRGQPEPGGRDRHSRSDH